MGSTHPELQEVDFVATLQATLTTFMGNAQLCSVTLSNSQGYTGIITDDGTGGDCFILKQHRVPVGGTVVIIKSQVCTITDPASITTATDPGTDPVSGLRLL